MSMINTHRYGCQYQYQMTVMEIYDYKSDMLLEFVMTMVNVRMYEDSERLLHVDHLKVTAEKRIRILLGLFLSLSLALA